MTHTIYRFKFAPDFQLALENFANVHRFDDISVFREKWQQWCEASASLIRDETNRLDALGFTKSMEDKMYKSVRYYFKNKPLTKKEPRQRKKYVGLGGELLESISAHIREVAAVGNMKPALAYKDFIGNSDYNMHCSTEEQRLADEFNMDEGKIAAKLKKTYKNRYFIYQKREAARRVSEIDETAGITQ